MAADPMRRPATPPPRPVAEEDLESMRSDSHSGAQDVEDLPDPDVSLPHVTLYSHSTLFYWWPVWAYGFVAALVTYVRGGSVELSQVRTTVFDQGSAVGIGFIAVLLATILITNVRMRGLYSALFIVSVAFVSVLIAWLGWWDDIASVIPQLSVHLNLGFYLIFSSVLFTIWLATFLIFDRLEYWVVRPGQMTEEHLIGSRARSYDTQGMLFEKEAEDLFRHTILGLGAGDLTLTTSGGRETELRIPNVLLVDRKVRAIQRLVATKPDQLLGAA